MRRALTVQLVLLLTVISIHKIANHFINNTDLDGSDIDDNFLDDDNNDINDRLFMLQICLMLQYFCSFYN